MLLKKTTAIRPLILVLLLAITGLCTAADPASAGMPHTPQVTVKTGTLQGTEDEESGVRVFKGIPFAAPPVGDLRWREPQPPAPWTGVRMADQFGPRPMQLRLFGDMVFRSGAMSEDCLYLNVWVPPASAGSKLPVLFYIYGGGARAGDSSEPRYDGESMAKKGIVVVTANYRLNVFGNLALPELSKESPRKASGNYGLLDQCAALDWVRENIAAFGGDPNRITVAGESAGSISACALMASPLSRDKIAGVIGESGGIISMNKTTDSLASAEEVGTKFVARLGKDSPPTLAELRATPADKILELTKDTSLRYPRVVLDGCFFPKPPREIFAAGEQAHVPLLAGVNSEESGYEGILKDKEPTEENFRKALEALYPGHGEEVFSVYPGSATDEVVGAARDLAGDRFITRGTWDWIDLCTKTGKRPTYYYQFCQVRPPWPDAKPRSHPGAPHASEIEYALGNLDSNKILRWTPEDRQVSRAMQDYFSNFIKTGNPNGEGLPEWPAFGTGQRLQIGVRPAPESTAKLRARYELLDRVAPVD